MLAARLVTGLICAAGLFAAGAGTAAAADGPAKVTVVKDPRITESSGLAASPTDPRLVWTVNDSGDSARMFGVSLRTGRTLAVVRERTDARDCEAMASGLDAAGRSVLWIGDIGDNRAARTSVVLRLIREPAPIRSVTVRPVDLRVRYPGGPADAETLIWTPDGRLLIVTKALAGGTVLQVPAAAVRRALAGHSVEQPALASKVGSVSQVLPTDGVALPDGRLVVRDYGGATVYRAPAYDGGPLVVQRRLTLPSQRQGETVTAVDDGSALLVGSEGVRQPLWRVPVGDPVVSKPTSTVAAAGPTSSKSPAGQGVSLLWKVGAALAALGVGVVLVAAALGWRARTVRAGRRGGR